MKLSQLILSFALLLTPQIASAGSIERASAITAFDEGQALIEQGDLPAACEKFQESYELDAQLGSLLHLADCREQNGQLASAWGHFLSAAEWAEKQGDERAALATERAAKLAPRVSYLTLEFEHALPSGAVIKQNGVILPKQLWKKRFPSDNGECSLEISAVGYQTWISTVSVSGEGTTTTVSVPPLSTAGEKANSAASTDEANTATSKSLMARKWPAVVAAGIGVAGGVVWGVFGAQSMKAKSDADELCGEGFQCVDADGTDLRAKAYDSGKIATIGAIVTGVGLGAAGVLWLVLPGAGKAKDGNVAHRSRSDSAHQKLDWKLGIQFGGATLAGRF